MKKLLLFIFIVVLTGCGISAESQENTISLIAHRGAKDIAPEHTLSAYKKAIKLGADYIEIDLRMTKDGKLVSIHDNTLDRTTDGKGEVSQSTLDELKQLDAGSWFSEDFSDEEILSLEEIFDNFGKDTHYFIETRPVNSQLVMEENLLKLIKEKGLDNHVVIQSFSADSLKEINRINSDIPLVQLLYPSKMSEVNEDEIKKYAIGVGPYAVAVDSDFVKRMHETNIEVYVWFENSNEKEFIPDILSYGIDGVFTDFLYNTVEVIKKEKQRVTD